MYRRLSTLVLTSIVAGAVIGVLGKFALPPLGFGAIMLPTAVRCHDRGYSGASTSLPENSRGGPEKRMAAHPTNLNPLLRPPAFRSPFFALFFFQFFFPIVACPLS